MPALSEVMDISVDSQFWLGLLEIIGVNIVLSGDNAVVIALAARSLSQHRQRAVIVIGSGAAIALRVILTTAAASVLALPYLKLAGAVLLLWIGIQLLLPEDEDDGSGANASGYLMGAVRIILIADLVMSLDNVLAVAAAAHGNLVLLILGLGFSIPLIVFGSEDQREASPCHQGFSGTRPAVAGSRRHDPAKDTERSGPVLQIFLFAERNVLCQAIRAITVRA